MKYNKIIVNEEKGIVQITTSDERWYLVNDKYIPSVTWIAEYYPKGIAYFKWLANKGWDEATALKEAAGDKGSKVHNAINDLLDGKTIKMDSKYHNETLEKDEELTPEEYECLMSFIAWYKEAKPEIIKKDFVVHNETEGYAGTVDLTCKINGKFYVVDFKTSANIWPSHELQISAYKHALQMGITNLTILQLGYNRNKKKFKFTEIDDKFDLFLAAKKIWANETAGIEPLQRDFPMELKLNE